jgi:hypothetical protein
MTRPKFPSCGWRICIWFLRAQLRVQVLSSWWFAEVNFCRRCNKKITCFKIKRRRSL